MRLANLTEKNPASDTDSLSVRQEILCFLWNPKLHYHVEIEVLTEVVMKSSVFWDITPYSSMNVNRRFRGTCCLLLQGWRVNQTRNQHEVVYFRLVYCLTYPSTENMEATRSSETSSDIHYIMLYPRRQNSFIMFPRGVHWILSWATWMQSTTLHPILSRSNLILFLYSHLLFSDEEKARQLTIAR
jgi:hypothetical protein